MSRVIDFEINGRMKILVRAVNWLGDAVMTTPALGVIRAKFPDACITLLATPIVAEMFIGHPWIDEVMLFDRKGRHRGVFGRFCLARDLAARRFDLAILLPNSLDAAIVTWLAGINCRVGYATDGRGLLLSHPVPASVRPLTSHQTGYYTKMLEYWGISSEPMAQLLVTTAAEDQRAEELLSADSLVIGINPGATYGSAKRWYPERFAAVAEQLSERYGAKIVVTGSSDEAPIAAEIAAMVKSPLVNLAGVTTVRELLAVIKKCDLFITNDSGPMHIAAAFGVPVVAIFGSTDNTTTYPLSERAVVVRKPVDCAPCMKRVCPTDHRCMKEVTAGDVIAAAEQLLSAGQRKGEG